MSNAQDHAEAAGLARAADTWVPETAREWHAWLALEEQTTLKVYVEKPDLLIADHRRERDTTRDYEGRELLELLQNANDQAAEMQQPGRVLFELSPDGLIVANTGRVFSTGGVKSLQTSHLSPKRRQRKRLIGSKGLGFRAVLNWTKTPIVASGALRLAYSMRYTADAQKRLFSANSELARKVREEEAAENALVMPLLPLPLYTEDGALASRLDGDVQRRMFDRCQVLLEDAYDTAVAMPFSSSDHYKAVVRQMAELRPEILLFAEYLKELCFRRSDEEPVTWTRGGDGATPSVTANGKLLGRWRVRRRKAPLPVGVTGSCQNDTQDYEVVVAVPVDSPGKVAPLFSYFPTDVLLPLPVVCHATLELEQNRKHIQENRDDNVFVLGELAKLIAETAEIEATSAAGDIWAGLRPLKPLSDYPGELERVRFAERLLAEAGLRAIVPTFAGAYVRPAAARIVPGADPSWLPIDMFPEVVPASAGFGDTFLETLGVTHMKVEEVKCRIVARTSLTIEQRVALIAGLLGDWRLAGAYTPTLLLDSKGRSLAPDAKVFLAPTTGGVPLLPDWADVRFLDETMRTKLADRLGTGDSRELQHKLSGFGLLEYSLATVVQALVAGASRAQAAGQPNGMFYPDLLLTIFALFDSYKEPSKRPEYPVREARLRLPRQDGGETEADQLYLGSGYGTQGEIVQSLYGGWAREKLVDNSRLPHMTDDATAQRDFLLWVGVAAWPRTIKLSWPEPGYLHHALASITYPAMFGEQRVSAPESATRAFCTDVRGVDGLNGILEGAEPAAIVAWLARDDRSLSWGREDSAHATLQAFPNGVYNARTFRGALPSYIRWKVETTSWLQGAEGQKCQPKECVIGERTAEGLFPRPVLPDQGTLNRYGLQYSEVFEGWRRAGVIPSLAYLKLDEVYSILLNLPQRSPDGKLARTLYEWLLESADTAFGGHGPNRSAFLARGMMWARHGSQSAYYPTAELRYVDAEGLPAELLQRLKVVDLPKHASVEKVTRLFGVKAVDRDAMKQRVIVRELAAGSREANATFQAAKPYLHKLRVSQNARFTQELAFRELRLEVCSMLRAELSYEGQIGEVSIPVWGWMIVDSTLLVRADPARPISISESILAEVLGEALASVFRVADGGQFARVLSCPETDRLELLRLLGCESVPEDIAALKTTYDASRPNTDAKARFPVAPPDKRDGDGPSKPLTPEAGEPTPSATPDEPGQQVPPQVVSQQHTQAPPPTHVKLRITGGTPGGGWSSGHRVTDADFCEKKAVEFEEADTPPRFPLRVSHTQGYDGPECDILSFASEFDRTAFVNQEVRDLGLVIRFIEVKGRSDRAAIIELKGNEYDAAEKYGPRYCLYRLYEHTSGEYHLAILADPLSDKDALQPVVHVSPERAKSTQRFTLLGGATRTATQPAAPTSASGQ